MARPVSATHAYARPVKCMSHLTSDLLTGSYLLRLAASMHLVVNVGFSVEHHKVPLCVRGMPDVALELAFWFSYVTLVYYVWGEFVLVASLLLSPAPSPAGATTAASSRWV
jgi:hypothetical protein